MRTYKDLKEPLISYTCEKLKSVNLQKLGLITLIYEIILEAVSDLHSDDLDQQQDASSYFKGDLFEYHCKCVCISKQLMLRIVLNTDKYLKTVIYNRDENNESNIEFGDLP